MPLRCMALLCPRSARTRLQLLDQVAAQFYAARLQAATLGPVRIRDLAVVLVRLRWREPRLVAILATPGHHHALTIAAIVDIIFQRYLFWLRRSGCRGSTVFVRPTIGSGSDAGTLEKIITSIRRYELPALSTGLIQHSLALPWIAVATFNEVLPR